jgi:translation initiation factor 2B subunit (eIF-2B alpha/beta/delta family)
MNSIIKDKLRDLKQNKSSGASELIEKSIIILKDYLTTISNETKEINKEITELAREIIQSRPSMAPLINTVGYLIGDVKRINKKNLLDRMEQFSKYRGTQMNLLKSHFKTYFNTLYKPPLKIMLISHSSTINSLLSSYKDRDLVFYILESRPLLEGQKTAEFFSQYFETHLIIDAAIGKFMKEIDAVFVGLDSVLKDGSIINKIGTYPLAVLSKVNDKKFFAVGDSFKYNLRSHFGQKISIVKKHIKEVYENEITENLKVENYYFDITPAKYINKIISDLGVLQPLKFIDKVKSSLPIDWFKVLIGKQIFS